MQRKVDYKGMRVLCEVLFIGFTFCWIHIFQGDLVSAGFQDLFEGNERLLVMVEHHHLPLSIALTLFVFLFCLLGRLILRFNAGLYACNYLLASLVLGAVTGYDGESLFGQSSGQWLVAAAYSVALIIICKIVASVPKSSYNNILRSVTGNLFLMSLLFILTGFLGNTDENLHRQLRMESLMAQGEYEELLKVGLNEEESNQAIDMLRVQAMLNLTTDGNPAGSGIGEYLFSYSISDAVTLSDKLKTMDGMEPYLASCLLDGDLASFKGNIEIDSYREMPKYYLQALVMADDTLASKQRHFDRERAQYDEFLDELEPLADYPLQFRANRTYVKYHKTYYWFKLFCVK